MYNILILNIGGEMSKKNLKNGKNKIPKFDKEKAEKEFRIGAYSVILLLAIYFILKYFGN